VRLRGHRRVASPGSSLVLAVASIAGRGLTGSLRVEGGVVHWVPGHVGIDGNEEANESAKMAVEEASRALARSTAARKKCAWAKRGHRVTAFDPKAASEVADMLLSDSQPPPSRSSPKSRSCVEGARATTCRVVPGDDDSTSCRPSAFNARSRFRRRTTRRRLGVAQILAVASIAGR
jgi:hypothetical protein